MRSNTKRGATAVAATSSYSKTAFRRAARSLVTRRRGWSCLVLISPARIPRCVPSSPTPETLRTDSVHLQVHFIFRHKNPIMGEYEEKHLKPAPTPTIGKNTKLYTLIVNPDQTFQVLIDDKEVSSGSLLEKFDPPVTPSAEIDDPNDEKPADWV